MEQFPDKDLTPEQIEAAAKLGMLFLDEDIVTSAATSDRGVGQEAVERSTLLHADGHQEDIS